MMRAARIPTIGQEDRTFCVTQDLNLADVKAIEKNLGKIPLTGATFVTSVDYIYR